MSIGESEQESLEGQATEVELGESNTLGETEASKAKIPWKICQALVMRHEEGMQNEGAMTAAQGEGSLLGGEGARQTLKRTNRWVRRLFWVKDCQDLREGARI